VLVRLCPVNLSKAWIVEVCRDSLLLEDGSLLFEEGSDPFLVVRWIEFVIVEDGSDPFLVCLEELPDVVLLEGGSDPLFLLN
jgi:hypothetical protein